MLPFLLKNKAKTDTVFVNSPEYGSKPQDDYNHEELINMCVKLLVHGIKSDDYESVEQSLRTLFKCYDSLPHKEGPHE